MASIRQRSGVWQARVRRKGFPEEVASFKTKTEAQTWARGIESAMDQGSHRRIRFIVNGNGVFCLAARPKRGDFVPVFIGAKLVVAALVRDEVSHNWAVCWNSLMLMVTRTPWSCRWQHWSVTAPSCVKNWHNAGWNWHPAMTRATACSNMSSPASPRHAHVVFNQRAGSAMFSYCRIVPSALAMSTSCCKSTPTAAICRRVRSKSGSKASRACASATAVSPWRCAWRSPVRYCITRVRSPAASISSLRRQSG